MTITPVGAFKTTNGECFTQKQDAYRNEINFLANELRRIAADDNGPSKKEFSRKTGKIEMWLKSSKSLINQMNQEPDKEVAGAIANQE